MEFTVNGKTFEIVNGTKVNAGQLKKFFSTAYPARNQFLEKNWQWVNRSYFLENKVPLFIIHNNEIIGQAASIPFSFNSRGRKVSASWFIDLMVLPEFRGFKLATNLEQENMKLFEVCFGFPNDKSKPLLKKIGWRESSETYFHYYFINPLNHYSMISKLPAFLRIPGNFIYSLYPAFFASGLKTGTEVIEANEENIKDLFLKNSESEEGKGIKDLDFFKWRILDSPFSENYRIIKSGSGTAFLFRLVNRQGSEFIDILWCNDISDPEKVVSLMASLILWARTNKLAYIRYYLNNKKLSDLLGAKLHPTVKNPPVIYYSKNEEIIKVIESGGMNWGLIDSDFEWQVV